MLTCLYVPPMFTCLRIHLPWLTVDRDTCAWRIHQRRRRTRVMPSPVFRLDRRSAVVSRRRGRHRRRRMSDRSRRRHLRRPPRDWTSQHHRRRRRWRHRNEFRVRAGCNRLNTDGRRQPDDSRRRAHVESDIENWRRRKSRGPRRTASLARERRSDWRRWRCIDDGAI